VEDGGEVELVEEGRKDELVEKEEDELVEEGGEDELVKKEAKMSWWK
jgi:hypothetical protein